MYFYLLLEVDGQEAHPDLPRVVPGPEEEGAYAPVRWEARYVTRADTPTGGPAVLVFLDLEAAVYYAGHLLTDGADVAIVTTSDGEIQERAFGGDPRGMCIVDPSTEYPPGLPVEVGKLAEWVRTEEETRGE